MDSRIEKGEERPGKTPGILACCNLIFAVTYTVLYSYFVLENPDEGKPECCAMSTKVTPMPECPSADSDIVDFVNVSKRFKLFFQVMLVLNATALCTTLLSCLGDWCKSCRYIGAVLTLIVETVAAVMIIVGSVWRFGHEGKVCSGALLPPFALNSPALQ